MNELAAHSKNAEAMMRKIFVMLALMFSVTAWAGDLEDGIAAYDKQDYATAIVHFKAAAAKGNASAQNYLGVMYDEGHGVAQNYAEAVRWYKLAAAQGLDDAQYNLGVMYDEGHGVAQNYAEAVRWYKLAAAQGLADAQFNLGHMYRNGHGVAQNFVQAHVWFNLAATKSDKDAVKERNNIAKKMTQQQIAEAQKLARECLARNYKNCD